MGERYGPFDVAMIPPRAYKPQWFTMSPWTNHRRAPEPLWETAALPSESFWLLSHGETRKA